MDAPKRSRECKNPDVRREFVFNLSSDYSDPVHKSDHGMRIKVYFVQIQTDSSYQVKVTLDLKPEDSIFPLSAKSITPREILERQLQNIL